MISIYTKIYRFKIKYIIICYERERERERFTNDRSLFIDLDLCLIAELMIMPCVAHLMNFNIVMLLEIILENKMISAK